MPTKQTLSADFDKYMNAAQSAMFHCQMIEQGLKTYIFHAHEIVQARLPPEIGFAYKEAEYDSMPLERLLTVFAKFTHNTPLVKQLNALREARNYVAHRSFALAFLSGVSDAVDFDVELKKVAEASESSAKALLAFRTELEAISQLSAKIGVAKGVA